MQGDVAPLRSCPSQRGDNAGSIARHTVSKWRSRRARNFFVLEASPGSVRYSSSVTDAEWAILEPLLPAPGSTAGRGGRPEKHCRRVIVDAILYIARGGIAWRQLPVEFPSAGTVYAVFARWARSGAWQRISTRCATDCGCGPGGSGARPRRSSTRRRYPPPTPCPDPAAAAMAARERTASSGTSPWMRTVAARRRRHRRLDPGPRRRTPTPGRTARQLHHPAGLGRRRLPGRLLIWAKDVLTLTTARVIKRIPGAAGFHVRPRIWVVERSFALDQQAPPLRARLRNQTRPPRSHGPPRHDHDHDQATRPNLTIFKHPLRPHPRMRPDHNVYEDCHQPRTPLDGDWFT